MNPTRVNPRVFIGLIPLVVCLAGAEATPTAIDGATASSSGSLPSTWKFPPVEELPVLDGMPDPFVKPDGSRVSTPKEWPAQRAYLKAMLAHYLYGSMPPRPAQFDLKRLSGQPVFDGKAIHERYLITLNRNQKSATFHFELMRPLEGNRFPGIIKNSDSLFEDKDLISAKRDKEAAREAVSRGYLLCKFRREEIAGRPRGEGRHHRRRTAQGLGEGRRGYVGGGCSE